MTPDVPDAVETLHLEALAYRLALPTEIARPRQKQIARLLLRQHRYLGQRIADELAAEASERWPDPKKALGKLATQLIYWQDGHPASNSRPELRAVRRLVDEDVLLAARVAWMDGLASSMPIDPWLLALDPLPPYLDRDLEEILDRPLAEIHVHLWGAIPPIADWLPLMLDLVSMWEKGSLLTQASRDEELEVGELDELREAWIARLAEAALLRLWLAAAVRELTPGRHPFDNVEGLPESEVLEQGLERSTIHGDGANRAAALLEPLRDALAKIGYKTPLDRSAIAVHGCPIWVDPAGPCPYRDPFSQAAFLVMDEVVPQDAVALGERFLLAEALRLLRAPIGREATDLQARLERRLFRYLEIKLTLIRLLYFHPHSRGLDRFLDTLSRHNQRWRGGHRARQVWSLANERFWTHLVCRRWLVASTGLALAGDQRRPQHLAADLAKVAGLNQAKIAQLERKLELRVSPPLGADFSRRLHAQARGVRDALDGLSEAALEARGDRSGADLPSLPRFGVGFIFHLRKSSWTTPERHAERFGQIVAWLRDHPAHRPLVVGVDAAGSELDQGASDFLLAFRQLHAELDRPADTQQAPIMLGRTFHVGEDFRDLLTGIRQVDVVQRMLGFKAGDRLGHALVLGWSPERWYQRQQGMCLVHLGDHLLDLLWARFVLSEESPTDPEQLGIVKAYLERLGLPKGSETDAKKAARAWFKQRLLSSPQESFWAETEVQELIVRAVGKDKQPHELHAIRIEPQWIALVSRLQQVVARRVAAAGITIEANPTSNLAIGDLQSFKELPLLRQQPIRRDPSAPWPALRVAISTDDPGLFQAGLREELKALFDTSCESYPRDEVLTWIDRLCKTGYQSSFLRGPVVPGERFRDYVRQVTDG